MQTVKPKFQTTKYLDFEDVSFYMDDIYEHWSRDFMEHVVEPQIDCDTKEIMSVGLELDGDEDAEHDKTILALKKEYPNLTKSVMMMFYWS